MSISSVRTVARPLGRIVGFAGWLIVATGILLLLVPTLLGFDRYVIVSGSMHPVLDRGSVVFSKTVPVSELEVGDVITYTPPPDSGVTTLVTHRISRITTDPETGQRLFRTKGDANEGADPWTFRLDQPEQNVMRFSVPVVGHAILALADPQVRTFVVGIPAAIIFLMALFDVIGISLGRQRWAHS